MNAGADINAKDYDLGYTPLDLAIEKRRTALIDTLRRLGAEGRIGSRSLLVRNAYGGNVSFRTMPPPLRIVTFVGIGVCSSFYVYEVTKQ